MSSYFDAKSVLFNGCGTKPPRAAVINIDDEYGRTLSESRASASERVILYGMRAGDFRALNVKLKEDGSFFDLWTPQGSIKIETALIGGINVYNILAAAA